MSEQRGENGAWKDKALHVMWALIIAIMGWFLTESSTDRERIRIDMQRIEQRQSLDGSRTSVLEEQYRYVRESMQRIENGVDELRRDNKRAR